MTDITKRWALVTGASRGVGYRVALDLAKRGAQIIAHSRTHDGTAPLKQQLENAGHTVHTVAGELENYSDIKTLIDEVAAITENSLDILYNNAGVMAVYSSIFTPTVDDYLRCYKINTIAPIKLCDAFLPGMLERNWGRVVNITSGMADQPELMPYSCSKAALDRYVRDMLPTLMDTNVLLNLMDPGWLRTDLGGPKAPNDPDSVLPGATIPVLLDESEGSGKLYCAQDYRE